MFCEGITKGASMTRKVLAMIIVLLLISASLHAFLLKNPTNHFDATLAYSQSLTSVLQLQGTFNMNESFYVGVRFTPGSQVYYYSASLGGNTAYLLDYSNIALLLGLQFGTFNERFNCYFNAMPGFGFGTRQTGMRAHDRHNKSNFDSESFYPDMFSTNLTAVIKTEDQSFFSPAIEFGFNCQFTDNLIISTGWQVTAIAINDSPWKHYPWMIVLSKTDAIVFSIPVRLSWRF
jgi:hypothetical protein